jgi:hypothetical protein
VFAAGADQGFELGLDLGVVGEAAGLMLGVEQLVVQPDVKDALAAGYQLQFGQIPLVILDYCGRQTDGLFAVVSRHAVGDRQYAIHRAS